MSMSSFWTAPKCVDNTVPVASNRCHVAYLRCQRTNREYTEECKLGQGCTYAHRDDRGHRPRSAAWGNTVVKSAPLGREGTTLDIALAAVYLASDESSYVTGTDLTVDGGWMNV